LSSPLPGERPPSTPTEDEEAAEAMRGRSALLVVRRAEVGCGCGVGEEECNNEEDDEEEEVVVMVVVGNGDRECTSG
jgi:hypothetical protein